MSVDLPWHLSVATERSHYSPSHYFIYKFGRVSGLTNVGFSATDIYSNGINTKVYPGHPTGAPEQLGIFSANDADDKDLTGMRTIRVHGLLTSDSEEETTEDVTLEGQVEQFTTQSFYRCYRAYGLTYGSASTNVGVITVRHKTTTANVFATIEAGIGQTLVGAFTIPRNVTGYLDGLNVTLTRASGAAGSAVVSLRVRDLGAGGYNVKRIYGVTTAIPLDISHRYGITFAQQSDIKWTVESVSDSGSNFTADLNLVLIRTPNT